MNVVLWVIAAVLAAGLLASGGMKLSRPKEKLAASGFRWTEDFSPVMVKLIGGLEVLAAIGLILPGALRIASVLVPLAALGVVLLMIGAAITHVRRKEYQAMLVPLVLLVPAALIVWGRFGPYMFTS